jgi:hypothetical protein
VDLFTNGELASYLQVAEVDDATADLARDLVTTEIRLYAGATTYDALSGADLASFKGIALEAAKRTYLNPSGLRSAQIDDYSETFATETITGASLTDLEQARIDRILGRQGSAFSIRPYGTADRCASPFWRRERHL